MQTKCDDELIILIFIKYLKEIVNSNCSVTSNDITWKLEKFADPKFEKTMIKKRLIVDDNLIEMLSEKIITVFGNVLITQKINKISTKTLFVKKLCQLLT